MIKYKLAAMEKNKTVQMARRSFYPDNGGVMYNNSN
jgi:hypothetical protein